MRKRVRLRVVCGYCAHETNLKPPEKPPQNRPKTAEKNRPPAMQRSCSAAVSRMSLHLRLNGRRFESSGAVHSNSPSASALPGGWRGTASVPWVSSLRGWGWMGWVGWDGKMDEMGWAGIGWIGIYVLSSCRKLEPLQPPHKNCAHTSRARAKRRARARSPPVRPLPPPVLQHQHRP